MDIEAGNKKAIVDGLFAFIFITTIIIMALFAVLAPASRYQQEQIDEGIYKNITRDWNDKGIGVLTEYRDTKPITFLFLQKVLQADKTNIYTRALNIILIIACTLLIKDLTKSNLAYLFPVIPAFFNSMWLTVEIVEVFFVLLAIRYRQHAGWFIGLAAAIRPYAALYSVLLKWKQIKKVIVVGVIVSAIMLYLGLFFPYLSGLIDYGTFPGLIPDYGAFLFLLPFAIVGTRNKEIFSYGVIACVPLLVRTWGHYFIVPASIFFLSYLSNSIIWRNPQSYATNKEV